MKNKHQKELLEAAKKLVTDVPKYHDHDPDEFIFYPGLIRLVDFEALKDAVQRVETFEALNKRNKESFKGKFIVLSPDGLPIDTNTYKSEAAAKSALAEWVKRYEPQGYYSGVRERIPLADLPQYCLIVEKKGRQ